MTKKKPTATSEKPDKGRAGRPAGSGEMRTVITVRVPPDLKRAFVEWCDERDVDASDVVRWMMRDVIAGTWKPKQFQ